MENKMHASSPTAVPNASPPLQKRWRSGMRSLLPGLLLSGIIAAVAILLSQFNWLESHGLSALTIAIILGIGLGNTLYSRMAAYCEPGVIFSKQSLLRLGIILYGFRLTFQDLSSVGLAGVVIDALVLTSTFAISMLVGIKLLKLDRNTAVLIGAGSSICGAAAVMAAGPVVRGRAEQVTVAVSTVVVFGTLAIFVYPALYRWNLQWHLLGMSTSASQFGIFAGSTVHEVAQVVAAAKAVNQEAANTAVITKMVRVMMLAPFLIFLSAYLAKPMRTQEFNTVSTMTTRRITIPWFAFAFIGVVAFNSLSLLPSPVIAEAVDVDTILLATAMAALGLTTHFSAIRRAGFKPLVLALVLFLWLLAGGAMINRLVMAYFA
jgi:uncharacterized integral membrane protein (TIGR00698 family)